MTTVAVAVTTSVFDFLALQAQIVAASRKAFADMKRLSPRDPVCSFALYSDDGAMTVCPAFDTAGKLAARLAANQGDLSYKFSPAEWAYESKGAVREFDRICASVGDHAMSLEKGFATFRKQLFETCLNALDELRDAGQFATTPPMLVMFDVSDSDISKATQIARMKRLNGGAPHVAELAAWTKTWGVR